MKRSELARTGFARKPAAEPKRRQRKCKICRTLFEPRSITHSCCGPVCAESHAMNEKARKTRQERQEGLAKLKTRADHFKVGQR
jgi:hypothetical protein